MSRQEEADVDVSASPSVPLSCPHHVILKSWEVTFFAGSSCALQTKLSRLCEQDKVVRAQGSKVQQLHREKVSGGPPFSSSHYSTRWCL